MTSPASSPRSGLQHSLSAPEDEPSNKIAAAVATVIRHAGPAIKRSRAGQGSEAIAGASLSCLAVSLISVAALSSGLEGNEGAASSGVVASTNETSFDDTLACNHGSLGPLISELQQRSLGSQNHDWDDAYQIAVHLQQKLGTLAAVTAVQPEPEPEPEPEEKSLWYVGVGLSTCACFASVFGYNLVKHTHTQVAKAHAAGNMEVNQWDFKQFYLGWFLSIVFCAGLDTIAYNFAPVEMLAPLGGVTLVLNIYVANLINKEEVYRVDGAIALLIVFGIVVTVSSVPAHRWKVDAPFLDEKFTRSSYVLYELMWTLSAYWVYLQTKKVYGDNTEEGIAAGRAANPKLSQVSIVLWPWVGSVFTSNMNVFIKCFLEHIKGGSEVFTHFWFYWLVIILAPSIYCQLTAINTGLAREGALTFVPIKTGMNVVNMSVHSCILFQTMDLMEPLLAFRYIVGLATVSTGIAMILTRPVTEDDYESAKTEPSLGALPNAPPNNGATLPYEPPVPLSLSLPMAAASAYAAATAPVPEEEAVVVSSHANPVAGSTDFQVEEVAL